jgi:hypothetical protein
MKHIMIASMILLASALAQADPPQPTMKIGIHAPQNQPDTPSLDLPGVRVFRVMTTHYELYQILHDPPTQDLFEALIAAWADECVRPILTIRMPCEPGSDLDCIPSNQPAALQILEEFATEYAADAEAFQIGNEIFGGPGTLFINDKEPDEWTEADFNVAFAWLADQATALRDGIEAAGCDTLVISPATTPGLVRVAARGAWDEDNPQCGELGFCQVPSCFDQCIVPIPEATHAVDRLIAFSNAHCDAMDMHLHSSCFDEVEENLTLLLENPCGLLATTPQTVTCMEWSAAHAAGEWLALSADGWPGFSLNAHVLFEFYRWESWCYGECGEELCPADPWIDTWNTFVGQFATWFETQLSEDLASFNVRATAAMASHGLLHACYAGAIQVGLPRDMRDTLRNCGDVTTDPREVYMWDVTSLLTTKTTSPWTWNQPIVDAFIEAAAAWPDPNCPQLPGDKDGDGMIDLYDFDCLSECLEGPGAGVPVSCACELLDLDGDDVVTLLDFALLENSFTGP